MDSHIDLNGLCQDAAPFLAQAIAAEFQLLECCVALQCTDQGLSRLRERSRCRLSAHP